MTESTRPNRLPLSLNVLPADKATLASMTPSGMPDGVAVAMMIEASIAHARETGSILKTMVTLERILATDTPLATGNTDNRTVKVFPRLLPADLAELSQMADRVGLPVRNIGSSIFALGMNYARSKGSMLQTLLDIQGGLRADADADKLRRTAPVQTLQPAALTATS